MSLKNSHDNSQTLESTLPGDTVVWLKHYVWWENSNYGKSHTSKVPSLLTCSRPSGDEGEGLKGASMHILFNACIGLSRRSPSKQKSRVKCVSIASCLSNMLITSVWAQCLNKAIIRISVLLICSLGCQLQHSFISSHPLPPFAHTISMFRHAKMMEVFATVYI